MSLKGFHIVFIVLAVVCTLGFFGWTRMAPSYKVADSTALLGTISGVLGLLLIPYGFWFIKKSRHIIT